MNNFDSYLMKRVLPYDKRLKTVSRAIEMKDIELSVLKNCYENLLEELKEIVGPKNFAKYVQKASSLPDEQDLTDEEMLILLKLFDFSIPTPEADVETTKKVIKLKTLIQESDFRSLMRSPEIKTFVKSPEFYLMVNNDNFRDLLTQERLMSLVKSSEFKDLLYNPDFKAILARSGLVLPLKPFDLQMPFSISILKSIMRLERIFEDFRVNRCAEYSPVKVFKPVRSALARSLSPRRSSATLTKSPTCDSLLMTKNKTISQNSSSLNLMSKLNKTNLE